ncbi:MAG: universal stress protein [Weeksellaceae bacterium]
MKHILVPTDFSKAAENALDFALQTAKIIPSKITLLHSFEVEDNKYTDYMGVNREFNKDMIFEANVKLNEVKIHAQENFDVPIEVEVSTLNLNDAINITAKQKKVDLVVMGTLGRTGLIEKLWGSHTSSLIGKAMVPIMAIPIDFKWKQPKHMLLATKKFERNTEILDFVFEWANLYMANVNAAVFTHNEDTVEDYQQNKSEMAEYEQFLKKEYHDNSLTSTHLLGLDFEAAVESYIAENNIDMLVMITYQNGFWKNLFNPSVTKKMSYNTKIPLLAIPANYPIK